MTSRDPSEDAAYEDIVSRYRSGTIGRDAFFSALFDKYYPTLIRYGVRMGFSAEESRELAQESFVRGYRYIDQLDPGSSLLAALLTTFRNVAYNQLRARSARKREGVVVPDVELAALPADVPDAEDVLIANAQIDQLRDAMAKALTPDEAALLISRFVEDLSYSEIAGILQVSVSTVRFRMERALVKLKRYVATHQLEGGSSGQ